MPDVPDVPDVSDPLSTLALTGATTVVAAMATEAWETTRDRTAALFRWRRAAVGEGGTRPEVEAVAAELDESAAQVRGAGGSSGTRGAQTEVWRQRLIAVLRQEPQAQAELRDIVDEARARPTPEGPGGQATVWQNITASGNGRAYGVAGPGSSMHIYQQAPPAEDDVR